MKLPDLAEVFAEANRRKNLSLAAALIAAIAVADWKVSPNLSLGSLYLFPILLAAAFLGPRQLAILATGCSVLREALSPFAWDADVVPRTATVVAAFWGAGLLVRELTRTRQLAVQRLGQIQQEVKLRQEAEEQLRVLVESSPAAILTLDAQGTILLANEAAQRLLAFDQEPLRGRPIGPHLPVLATVLGTNGATPFFRATLECTGRRRDGEVFLAQVCFSTYETLTGPRLAAIVWDASDSLRDREGLKLDSALTTSRILVGAMAHEVRNLSAAAAVAHANLERVAGVAESEDFKALGTLVQGLGKLAAAELGQAGDPESVTASLDSVLDELRIVIQPLFDGLGAEILWDIHRDMPRVHADHHGLLQVFLNLAHNSRRAMAEAEQKQLRVTAACEEGRVVVRFEDTGGGIPVPERLFQPFQQGADANGLGLYVSREIIRSFGGGLYYEPKPSGSCFTLDLAPAGCCPGGGS